MSLSREEARHLRSAKELEGHVAWFESFTPAALGVLAAASGIYTFLGVSSLLEKTGALSVFAAVAYSVAVSVGIFVFWAYVMRVLPSMRTAAGYFGMLFAMLVGSAAIVAMSSWLNAAALAGSAAVEQHLQETVQEYQGSLETAHEIAISGQSLQREVSRARQAFEDLSALEAGGQLSGFAGRGTVFRVLTQKAAELTALEAQIAEQELPIQNAFEEGNATLARMRALTVGSGAVQDRSLSFSEESVRLAAVITRLRQLSVAPLVARAADDLVATVVLPELDGRSEVIRGEQTSTINQVLVALENRATSLKSAAEEVLAMPQPAETTYTPISSAVAVIKYAGDFVPSWAGAIAIDLMPGVLVLILAVTQGAIRAGRDGISVEDTLTLTEMRSAVRAMKEIAAEMEDPAPEEASEPVREGPPAPPHLAEAPRGTKPSDAA